MLRLAVLNPNTNSATTDMMTAIVRANLPPGILAEGHSMTLGPPVIAEPVALAKAVRQVVTVGEALARDGVDAILIAGFGDPGLAELRDRLGIPVIGIAEAGMAEAAAHGRFAIITTTPDLRDSIRDQVSRYGHDDSFASLQISRGGVARDMADSGAMARALVGLIDAACAEGADAVLIGGGPLAQALGPVRSVSPVPVIEPVAAGARAAARLLGAGSARVSEAGSARVPGAGSASG